METENWREILTGNAYNSFIFDCVIWKPWIRCPAHQFSIIILGDDHQRYDANCFIAALECQQTRAHHIEYSAATATSASKTSGGWDICTARHRDEEWSSANEMEYKMEMVGEKKKEWWMTKTNRLYNWFWLGACCVRSCVWLAEFIRFSTSTAAAPLTDLIECARQWSIRCRKLRSTDSTTVSKNHFPSPKQQQQHRTYQNDKRTDVTPHESERDESVSFFN